MRLEDFDFRNLHAGRTINNEQLNEIVICEDFVC